MKPDPLPAEFVAWLTGCIRSARFRNSRSLFRGLVLRWTLWGDGVTSNALPGYATCPPAAGRGLPAGWSYQVINDIAREAIGTDRIHSARKHAASLSQSQS